MPKFLTDPAWVGIILTALGGIVTTAFSLIQTLGNRTRKELTYKVQSNASLVQRAAQNAVKIALNDGTLISDADLLVLSVKNTGNSTINREDYTNDKPVVLDFPGSEVLHITDIETAPAAGLVDERDVVPSPRGIIPGHITLDRPELKKDASIILSILMRGAKVSQETITHRGDLNEGQVKSYQAAKGLPRRFVAVGIGAALMLVALVLAIFYTLLPSPSSIANCASGSIAIGGSTALLPLVSTMTQTYHQTCPRATISINQNVASSKAGLSTLEAGTIQIGDSDMISSNLSLIDHPVAAVIYVMIVNPAVSLVSNLSLSQIQNIYNGSFTNWSQVGGNNTPIFVVNRTSTSGTRATFEKYILDGKTTPFPASKIGSYDEEDTSGLVARKVAATPGAIGYVDLRDAQLTPNLKIVTIGGVEATSDNVKSDAYAFWTIEHIYTQGNPSDLTNAFIQYITSNGVKSLISNLGYVPFNDMPSATVNQHPSPKAPDGL